MADSFVVTAVFLFNGLYASPTCVRIICRVFWIPGAPASIVSAFSSCSFPGKPTNHQKMLHSLTFCSVFASLNALSCCLFSQSITNTIGGSGFFILLLMSVGAQELLWDLITVTGQRECCLYQWVSHQIKCRILKNAFSSFSDEHVFSSFDILNIEYWYSWAKNKKTKTTTKPRWSHGQENHIPATGIVKGPNYQNPRNSSRLSLHLN